MKKEDQFVGICNTCQRKQQNAIQKENGYCKVCGIEMNIQKKDCCDLCTSFHHPFSYHTLMSASNSFKEYL